MAHDLGEADMGWSGRALGAMGLALMGALPAGTAAAAVFANERTDVLRGVLNTCNGETATMLGTSHLVITENKDGTFTYHYQLHSEGVGSQGRRYVLNLVRESDFDSSQGFEIRVDEHDVLASKGWGPNWKGRFHYDAAAGEFEFDQVCTG